MSSINYEKGRRIIQIVCSDGKRRSIRLGKMSDRDAIGVRLHVDRLIQSKFSNMPLPAETASWLGEIDEVLHGRLVRVQLCKPRETDLPGSMTLGTMLDNYIARRIDLKEGSIKMLKQTRDKLVKFYGADRPIGSITVAEAADFKRTRLITDSVAYVAKQILLSRQFFKDAVDREILIRSPFAKIKPGSQKNPRRQHFVARELIDRAIEHAPDLQWKLIIALARYGGLRVPSEVLALRWADINWKGNRILIRASKTEHHVGHEQRDCPLFPELRPLLIEAKKEKAPDAMHVITRYRSSAANLRTQFRRILADAEIKPWPKIFQNLRSTRQTELTEDWAAHLVCGWLGNSEKVAQDHYLQTTQAHFDQAAGVVSQKPNSNENGGGNGGSGGAENGAAPARSGSQVIAPTSMPLAASANDATTCDIMQVVIGRSDLDGLCRI